MMKAIASLTAAIEVMIHTASQAPPPKAPAKRAPAKRAPTKKEKVEIVKEKICEGGPLHSKASCLRRLISEYIHILYIYTYSIYIHILYIHIHPHSRWFDEETYSSEAKTRRR